MTRKEWVYAQQHRGHSKGELIILWSVILLFIILVAVNSAI